jgi:ABC-type iron transport system FetAB permease component
MGSILSMILIGWIAYYICVLEEDVSQLRMVSLSKINANDNIEKGQHL